MALVEAFDKRTGKPVPHLVPEHYFDNPKLRGNYVRTQAAASAAVNATQGARPTTQKEK